MARERLVSLAVDRLIDLIVAGEFAPGKPLPAQPALAQKLEVSRLTVREAVETLRSRRIVTVVHGRGTFVTPPEEWADADAISRLVGRDGGESVSTQVIEVRRLIEIGAAELCAARRDTRDVEDLERLLGEMRAAHESGDLEDFVRADMAFHDVVLRGCGNPFLLVAYDPLMRVLRRTRAQTSAVPLIREHALERHGAIVRAIREADPAQARSAMEAHMAQTSDDLHAHVLGDGDHASSPSGDGSA